MDTNIMQLPIELLGIIFQKIDKPNDRRRLAQVCKRFYDVIRQQSKHSDRLIFKAMCTAKSPFTVFNNSEIFPFSKMKLTSLGQLQSNDAFWERFGSTITDLKVKCKPFESFDMQLNWLRFFPMLKTLKIKGFQCDGPLATQESCVQVVLPIEELSLESKLNPVVMNKLLQSSPFLKRIHFVLNNAEHLDLLLPWIETIERVRLVLGGNHIALCDITRLPSKVLIENVYISPRNETETIVQFFSQPRIIQNLNIQWRVTDLLTLDELVDFNNSDSDESLEYLEQNLDRDQLLAIMKATSVQNVNIINGPPSLPEALDLLAQLTDLESIHLNCKFAKDVLGEDIHPFNVTSRAPDTALKIRGIVHDYSIQADCLNGLTNLISFSIPWRGGFEDDHQRYMAGGLDIVELQLLIQNCPNLETLEVQRIIAIDECLIGNEIFQPFSSLKKLKNLVIMKMPYITVDTFKYAFVFPHLEKFVLSSSKIDDIVAKLLAENLPNLEILSLGESQITNEGFELLVRNLPYLRSIEIGHKSHLVTLKKVEEIKDEFPYLNIRVEGIYQNVF